MPSNLQFLNKQTMRSLVLAILLLGTSNFVFAQNVSVLDTQNFLIQNGYSPGAADGIMGGQTRAALRDFQRDQRIPQSGEIDVATRAAIRGAITSVSETSGAEVGVAIDDGEKSAGPEPLVPPARSDDAGKAAVNLPSEISQPITLDTPLSNLPNPPTPADGFSHSEEIGETGRVRVIQEETPPVSVREVARDEPQVSPSTRVYWWIAAATVFWIYWQRRKRRKTLRSSGAKVKRTDSPTQEQQRDSTTASSLKRNAPQTATAPDSALSWEEKSSSKNIWSAEQNEKVAKPPPKKRGQKTMPRPWGQRKKSGWISSGETVIVAGRDIGDMVYVGVPPRSGQYGGTCGAYIDPSLSVAKIGGDLQGHGMHYWPNYSDISATDRATYLDWLQSGRSDFDYNPGYMFLYFYGLERRFFVDDPDPAEKQEILDEVIRLRQAFSDNYSAKNYLSRFIEVAELSLNPDAAQKPIFSNPGYEFPLSLSVVLGEMIAKNEPLTADWALSWLSCHPERRLRTPAQRCEKEFHALFRLKFEKLYPNGMRVRRPKKTLKAHYQSASGEFDLAISPTTDGAPIPDISGIRKPLNDAQRIADSAMDELDKFSRYLGRSPDGRGTMEAQALLPPVLWSLFPSAELEALADWAQLIVTHGGLVPAVELVEKLENAHPDKISKRQLTGVADALARLGYGMAPDPRFALRSPKYEDPVVIFKLPEGVMHLEDVTDRYRSALMELALGTFIAQADGKVVPLEEEALRHSVHSASGLTQSESARLEANLTWLLAVPPDMGVFRTKLKSATEEQRNAFTQAVVVMAHADSIIRPEEVGGIEKVYKALGLNLGAVYADIHAAAVSDIPVAVRGAHAGAKGEAIPKEETSNNGPTLNVERIAAIKMDTARVSSVLGEIFGAEAAQDTEEEQEPDGNPGEDVIETRFSGLDAKHAVFVAELIGREHWNENEFGELAGRYGLMPSGCLEAINEWAFEKYDDALIEEYDGYELNPDIIHSLQDT